MGRRRVLQRHPHFARFELGGIGADGFLGVAATSAGLRVEGPAVQGAMEAAVFHEAGSEGFALVGATVVEGVEVAVEVDEGEIASGDVDGAGLARGQAISGGGTMPHGGRRGGHGLAGETAGRRGVA